MCEKKHIKISINMDLNKHCVNYSEVHYMNYEFISPLI